MPPDSATLHLTFDDGPDPGHTPRILDLLAAAGARATFFMLGASARQHPALVRRVVAEGHEVGNHGWRHAHPWTLGSARAALEVRAGHEALADLLGAPPRWYRPAHGRRRRCMIDAAAELDAAPVLWTRSAIDWGPRARPIAVARRLQAGVAGDVLLMHDARRRHNRPDVLASVLPDVLEDYRRRGLMPGWLTREAAARCTRAPGPVGALSHTRALSRAG